METPEFKNHYILEAHADGYYGCRDEHNGWFNPRKLCESSKSHLLLQVGYKYIIISYHRCLEGYDHLEFKHGLLSQVCKEMKHQPPNRSIHYSEQLKRSIDDGFNFRESFTEISYLYSDNAGKKYCFVTTHKFTDVFLNEIEENHIESYFSTKEYIEKNLDTLVKDTDLSKFIL